MDNSKKEIITTIVCSAFVAVTAVISAFVARSAVTTYDVKIVPSFEMTVTSDYFPLKKGNQWTYEGEARNAVVGGGTVEKKVRLRMRVVDEVEGMRARLFIMQGHPSDVSWALEAEDAPRDVVEIPPTTYGFLVVGNKVFQIPERTLEAVKHALRNGGWLGEVSPTMDDLDFEFPLFRGQSYGEPSQLARDDLGYAWYVQDSTIYHHPEYGRVKECPRYSIVYSTIPDYTQVEFIPYLGIVSYSYSHHGTTAQADVSLKDYSVHTD